MDRSDLIEEVRQELRGIMAYRTGGGGGTLPPKVIDVAEDGALVERRRYRSNLAGLELVEYRNRVQRVLLDLIDACQAIAHDALAAMDHHGLISGLRQQASELRRRSERIEIAALRVGDNARYAEEVAKADALLRRARELEREANRLEDPEVAHG